MPDNYNTMYVRLPILQRYVCQISTLRDGDLGGWLDGDFGGIEKGDPLGGSRQLG